MNILILWVPIFATIVSIIGFVLISLSLKDKPWRMKGWMITSTIFWITWSLFTVLLRLSNDPSQAIWYLRFSFISLQTFLYAAYRFHHLMVFKPTDNRIETFGLAILLGFNISLSLNRKYLDITDNNGYFTDSFNPILMIPNIIFGLWAAYWIFISLKEMDAMSIFYEKDNQKKYLPTIIFAILMLITSAVLVKWLIETKHSDATPFIIILSLAFIFLTITYGINPSSNIFAPQRLWSFIIIDKSGLLQYEYHFSKDQKLERLALFSMAITASNTTIMKNLNSKTVINEVSLKDRSILIEKSNELLFCLIADHNSIQLQILLQEAIKRIVSHNKFELPKLGERFGKFNYTDGIMKSIFQSKFGEEIKFW